MNDKPKHPGGRPTDYREEYCDAVVEYGKQGKSMAWMASELGVCIDTIYEWAKVHPKFSEALKKARTHSQRWWEDAGQIGMERGGGFNAGVWNKNMSCRFRDDWTETNKTELTGGNGGPLVIAKAHDLTDEQLAAIASNATTSGG